MSRLAKISITGTVNLDTADPFCRPPGTKATAIVTVKDVNGDPVENAFVTTYHNQGKSAPLLFEDSPVLVTDAQGQATFTFFCGKEVSVALHFFCGESSAVRTFEWKNVVE